jgi:hypothetical protein
MEKLCKDCKHYFEPELAPLGKFFLFVFRLDNTPICRADNFQNLVTGEDVPSETSCYYARRYSSICGPEAKRFEPKE